MIPQSMVGNFSFILYTITLPNFACHLTICGYKTFCAAYSRSKMCRRPSTGAIARSAACSRPLSARFLLEQMTSFPCLQLFPSSRFSQPDLVENNLRKLLLKLFQNNHKLKQIEQKNFMKIDVLFSRMIVLFPNFSQLFSFFS